GRININMADGSVRNGTIANLDSDGHLDAFAMRVEPQVTTGQFLPFQPDDASKRTDQQSKEGKSQPGADHFQPAQHRAKANQDSEGKEDGGKQKDPGDGQGKARVPSRGFGPGQGSGPGKIDPKPTQPAPEPAAPRRIIIRSGDIEFEIESFDSAVATVTKLVM